MNYTCVVLRATDVARVLEGDPWVTRLEDHLEHGLPQVDCRHFLTEDFTALGLGLVFDVALFEFLAVGFVKVRRLVGVE